jgi:Tfp pilus assembly protein PilV
MRANEPTRRDARGEAGFTLVEALVAMVVLIFGLMAVTNLMLVAASSNSVANQGTAAVATATRVMEMLKASSFASFSDLALDWEANPGGGKSCSDPTLAIGERHCTDDVPGVGQIHVHWWLTQTTDVRGFHVRVQAEGLGALSGARSRAEFTTFRTCTNVDAGCPDPAGGGGPSPSPSPTP